MAKKKDNIVFIDKGDNGIQICNRYGDCIMSLNIDYTEKLYNLLIEKRERHAKKKYPLRHTMITKFSDMDNNEVRMEMKIRNETFAGTIKKVKK